VSGIECVADTNILIYLLEGRVSVDPYIKTIFAASVVSEIELMGWYKIDEAQKEILHKLIDRLYIIELLPDIKQIAINIKQQHKIKLPDAIIAATAMHLDVPLLTADRGFEKIKNLDVLIIPI